ncbi:hypothetical protein GCM10023328_33170 [Modestobacter marinus]|uniref:Membrane protein DedA with SNARE-associated domain n=1 Tax=Modestobacter marinus TaxID=477641 RepID=A0A846LPD6_9ACTN|nr:DedA family protein [Modestobacter marinus]NIH69277.1 membrane protein DedA with SNARE-associated domain [Modestobacter marinus]GGL86225.1 hypothetical protein GCM10011589_48290 [Modestobacter marinus]
MTVLAQTTSGSSGDNLTGLAGWAADTMTSLGGPGVGAIVALENLFPPIPSEVVLPLAGFLAGQGRLSVVAVIAWATAGSVAGALVLYALGAVFGRQRLLRMADRLPLISIDDVQRAERWFARRGGQAVLLGRFVPVVRSLVSIPAGVERMPLLKFTLYTTIGSALWNSLFVLLGYALGSRWQQVGAYSSYINNAAIGLIGLAVVVIVIRRLRARRPTPE